MLQLTLVLSFSPSLMANVSEDEGVAKVIVIRGSVKAQASDGSVFDVTKDMWLAKGTVLQSADKSFCRLLFIDRSTMNLGPDSQLKIDEFPTNEAGVITLMKGQVRSKVTKDYMKMDDKDKSKLFIKTKTAAMGVRGTDFQVNFNPANENTALITFSGAVAMAQLDAQAAQMALDQTRLESVVSSDRAVMVREGEFSGVTSTTSRATIPTKINPVQFESLKTNETGVPEESASSAPKEKYRNPVPPGVNAKAFANDPRENAAKEVAAATGVDPSAAAEPAASVPSTGAAAPEGFFNAATGEYAPPAGSVIDLATVNIVPPPKGAAFDPISGTYTLPPELGGVNPETGLYEAPAGLKLTDQGTFVAVSAPEAGGRTPASQTSEPAPVPTLASPLVKTDADVKIDLETSLAVSDTDLQSLVDETQLEVEREIVNEREQELIQTTTNATFRFTVSD